MLQLIRKYHLTQWFPNWGKLLSLLIEPSCLVVTVHMFTLRLYVSRDLTVTPCAEYVFLFAFLRLYLLPRRVLHGSFFE